MKRRGGARNAPDAKGMYQEALMIRKVKAYLAHVFTTIITDEEVIQGMTMMIVMILIVMMMIVMIVMQGC